MAQPLEQRRRCETAGLGRLRPEAGQPEPGLPPPAQPRLPFGPVVRYLAEADFPFCESRLRAPCFLTCLFFPGCSLPFWRFALARPFFSSLPFLLSPPVGHPFRAGGTPLAGPAGSGPR